MRFLLWWFFWRRIISSLATHFFFCDPLLKRRNSLLNIFFGRRNRDALVVPFLDEKSSHPWRLDWKKRRVLFLVSWKERFDLSWVLDWNKKNGSSCHPIMEENLFSSWLLDWKEGSLHVTHSWRRGRVPLGSNFGGLKEDFLTCIFVGSLLPFRGWHEEDQLPLLSIPHEGSLLPLWFVKVEEMVLPSWCLHWRGEESPCSYQEVVLGSSCYLDLWRSWKHARKGFLHPSIYHECVLGDLVS